MKKIILLSILAVSSYTFSQTILIKNVNIVNVESGEISTNQNLLIEENKISKISNKSISSSNVESVIDGDGKYLIPGLIDTHIHFFQSGSLYTRPDALDLTAIKSYADETEFAEGMVTDSFKKYLRLGITTIADVGGPFSNFKIRDSIAISNTAPNVLVTGPLFSPYQPDAFANLNDVPIAKINSIKQADSLFSKMIKFKPDFIKVWYIVNDENTAKNTYPIVQHIAQLTHDKGLKLAVHATNHETAELAVKAGANILVHSVRDTSLSKNLINLMKKNNVSYNPTLIVSNNYIKTFLSELDLHPQDLKYANSKAYGTMFDLKSDDLEKPKRLKNFIERADKIKKIYKVGDSIIAKNLITAIAEGLNVITGTDAGNIGTMHASSYIQEIEAMSNIGLSNSEILKASTINAAKAFDLDDTLGTIEKGKIADMVLLNENPLENILALTTISEVFKNGERLDLPLLSAESPEDVVQRQVNAYNARDIDAFMETYADNIKVFNFPEKISIDGKVNMRERFTKLFEKVPNLYCEIKNRIVLGNKVVDREHVRFGDKYSDVIAIYEVTEGKISKVTFVR